MDFVTALTIEILKSAVLLYIAYLSRKTSRTAEITAKAAQLTEQNTNHMKDELVALTKTSSHAEGVLDEKTRNKEQTEAQIFPTPT